MLIILLVQNKSTVVVGMKGRYGSCTRGTSQILPIVYHLSNAVRNSSKKFLLTKMHIRQHRNWCF